MTISQNDLPVVFKQAIEAVLWKAHVSKNDDAGALADELGTLVSMQPYDALGVKANISSADGNVVIDASGTTVILTWQTTGHWWATPTNDAAGPVSSELFDLFL